MIIIIIIIIIKRIIIKNHNKFTPGRSDHAAVAKGEIPRVGFHLPRYTGGQPPAGHCQWARRCCNISWATQSEQVCWFCAGLRSSSCSDWDPRCVGPISMGIRDWPGEALGASLGRPTLGGLPAPAAGHRCAAWKCYLRPRYSGPPTTTPVSGGGPTIQGLTYCSNFLRLHRGLLSGNTLEHFYHLQITNYHYSYCNLFLHLGNVLVIDYNCLPLQLVTTALNYGTFIFYALCLVVYECFTVIKWIGRAPAVNGP